MADAQQGAVPPDANEHPPTLINENPLSGPLFTVIGFVESYGWCLLLVVVVALYLKSKLSPHAQNYKKQYEEFRDRKKFDVDKAADREAAREAARQRLQEQLDAQAAVYAEKMKEKEEEKRQQKIEDWDGHLQGKGYRSKKKMSETPTAPKPDKAKDKKPLRSSDYNPLTGDGGSCSWRPVGGRRGGGG